jgi:hypothetical protein
MIMGQKSSEQVMKNVAEVIANSAVLNATIAGMMADNDQRKSRGESMAYTEFDFQYVINHSQCKPEEVTRILNQSQNEGFQMLPLCPLIGV